MKAVCFSLLLCLLTGTLGASPTPKPRPYKLYAAMLENTPVALADGSKWIMDKGDVFPVLMYKEQQTKIVLQLAGTNFWTDTKRVRILKPHEVEKGLENYRRNLAAYLESQPEKWTQQAGAAKQ